MLRCSSRGNDGAELPPARMPGAINLLMVEPINPYPVRQIATGKWAMVSDFPYRGTRDNRWWCVGHMVREADLRPVVALLLQSENRKLLVW
jgi:hypothetical protein